MSYISLEERITFTETKAELLYVSREYCVKEINAAIKSLKKQAFCLRNQAYELSDRASMLEDEVCRRAEQMETQMETRVKSTTDDDLK